MGFSLDVEDLRICLNEVDEVGDHHQIKEGVQKRRETDFIFLAGPFSTPSQFCSI